MRLQLSMRVCTHTHSSLYYSYSLLSTHCAKSVPSIVIDGKTFQLRDADDHMESTVGTASDDVPSRSFSVSLPLVSGSS
jgi:hypothetical protein